MTKFPGNQDPQFPSFFQPWSRLEKLSFFPGTQSKFSPISMYFCILEVKFSSKCQHFLGTRFLSSLFFPGKLENCDKIMHLRFSFDACPMHSRIRDRVLALDASNLGARALYCHNSGGGGALVFQAGYHLDIILVKGLSKLVPIVTQSITD